MEKRGVLADSAGGGGGNGAARRTQLSASLSSRTLPLERAISSERICPLASSENDTTALPARRIPGGLAAEIASHRRCRYSSSSALSSPGAGASAGDASEPGGSGASVASSTEDGAAGADGSGGNSGTAGGLRRSAPAALAGERAGLSAGLCLGGAGLVMGGSRAASIGAGTVSKRTSIVRRTVVGDGPDAKDHCHSKAASTACTSRLAATPNTAPPRTWKRRWLDARFTPGLDSEADQKRTPKPTFTDRPRPGTGRSTPVAS